MDFMSLSRTKQRASLLWYYTLGVLGLRNEDIILTSFPKSGNTWIRFFFCNLVSLREWDGETVTFPKLDATMPELGVSNLLRSWPYETIPRVVKTHKPRWSVFRGCRSILLVRDPRDVMVSYYHFEKGKKQGRFDGSFSSFLHHHKFGLRAWCEHLRSWRESADVIVAYERLKEDDVREFTRMLDAVDISLPRSLIEQAAERSRFEKVRKIESKSGVREKRDHFKEGKRFTRKGETGQWKEYFSTEDLFYLRSKFKKYDIELYDI